MYSADTEDEVEMVKILIGIGESEIVVMLDNEAFIKRILDLMNPVQVVHAEGSRDMADQPAKDTKRYENMAKLRDIFQHSGVCEQKKGEERKRQPVRYYLEALCRKSDLEISRTSLFQPGGYNQTSLKVIWSRDWRSWALLTRQ